MIEEEKDSSEIESWLEENPFVEGDFIIDTILFATPSKSYSVDSSFSLEETEVKERVRPPCNYLKFYLGSKNLWKKQYEEFDRALTELETAYKFEKNEKKLLKKYEEYRSAKENFQKNLIPFDLALKRIRKLAFEEKLMYDIESLDIIKGFRLYEKGLSTAAKREKVLKEKVKPPKLLIPFTIWLIDLEGMLVKAFLFHAGYLAGEAGIFEKIGRDVYGLRTSRSLSEEEIVRKALGNY
ncbi:MAG: hypothetical protein ACP5O8_02105 [Candidatus Aenigmatarchaeota archaeon]